MLNFQAKENNIQVNNFPITITRKKIKNMYLRVHPDGSITVSAPRRCSDRVIRDFVISKDDWIQMQLKKLDERKSQQIAEQQTPVEPVYTSGEIHYYRGYPCRLVVEETTGRGSVAFVESLQFSEESIPEKYHEEYHEDCMARQETFSAFGILHMRAPKNSTVEQRRHLLEEFYREQLKLEVPDLMEHYAAIVGKAPTEWHIRKMKTRWGTCNTRDKRIWLSLHLAKKPPECLNYVIVHELTHLHVPNHSKAFWARMDMYYPAWREVRKLLRE